MILNASELLGKFIEIEREKISGIAMPHMPTLGSAYEEITKSIMYQDFAIPKELDLRAVSGFISIGEEILPEQIDCMLVCGEGEQYGRTNNYIYDIDKILCIFEVKKTLRKSEYADAMQHLAKIRRKYAEYMEERFRKYEIYPSVKAAGQRFSQLTGKAAPDHYLGMHGLPRDEGILFYTLVHEYVAPVCIIHGYDGFKTEHGLRNAFVQILEDSWTTNSGLGIPSIPNLVTCGQFCNVKANGFPFLPVLDGEWVPVVSTCHNSALMMLEIIWAKISRYFGVEMPWNDGLYMNSVYALLKAKAVSNSEEAGWIYKTVEPKKSKLVRSDDQKWEPFEIGPAEISFIRIMAAKGGYLEPTDNLDAYMLEKHGIKLDKVLENLMKSLEFMMEGDYLRPISDCLHVLIPDEGKGYISYQKDRFDMWCKEKGYEESYLTIIILG